MLGKSEKYEGLVESYIIFIIEKDIFNDKNKAIHRFDRYDISDNTPLNDGSHIFYVNGEYKGEDDIGKLIHDFLCTEPNEMYFKELAEPARFYKETMEGKELMGNAFDRVREEGREEGIFSNLILSIRNLSETTGWSIDQAMTALKVPQSQRSKLIELISDKKNNA